MTAGPCPRRRSAAPRFGSRDEGRGLVAATGSPRPSAPSTPDRSSSHSSGGSPGRRAAPGRGASRPAAGKPRPGAGRPGSAPGFGRRGPPPAPHVRHDASSCFVFRNRVFVYRGALSQIVQSPVQRGSSHSDVNGPHHGLDPKFPLLYKIYVIRGIFPTIRENSKLLSTHALQSEISTYLILSGELKAQYGEIDDETLCDTLEGLSQLPDLIQGVARTTRERKKKDESKRDTQDAGHHRVSGVPT